MLVMPKLLRYRVAVDQVLRGLEQHATRAAVRIAEDIPLRDFVRDRQVGDAGKLERLAVDPDRMFRGVVDDERSVGNGPVKKRPVRRGRLRRAEIAARDKDAAVGMLRREVPDGGNEFVGMGGRQAALRGRQVEPVQGQRAEQEVHVRIHESRNHRLALEVDDGGASAVPG